MNGMDPCPDCGRDMEQVAPPVMSREPHGRSGAWVRCGWCLANRLEAGAKELEKTDVDLLYARRESESRILVLEAEGPWL